MYPGCRQARGIQTVAVTAGYMRTEARRDFYAKVDTVNVGLKAFTEEFYYKLSGAHLASILETLKYLKHETQTWFEITTLLIPGYNDSDAELGRMCEGIDARCAADPRRCITARAPHRHEHRPALRAHRQRAQPRGDTTFCHACHAPLIVRDWYGILEYRLTPEGRCPECNTSLAGRFEAQAGHFGRQRLSRGLASRLRKPLIYADASG